MTRDNFSARVITELADRVSRPCSNPDCQMMTVGPKSVPTGVNNLGEAAHITAASPGGPRYDPNISPQDRASIANAIWLCKKCARQIDIDHLSYSVERLMLWKLDAESHAEGLLRGKSSNLRKGTVRFSKIGLAPGTIWWEARRLKKAGYWGGIHLDFGFHVIPGLNWKSMGISPTTHSLDPVFDITLVNDSGQTVLLHKLGIEPLAIWTVLKGFSMAGPVMSIGTYTIPLTTLRQGTRQWMTLQDLLCLPAGAPLRFSLALKNFKQNLRGNELVMRILLEDDQGTRYSSKQIYMGVY